MNLLFIYGPPASGKLTIAEEIAASTGYKLFHNHLTMDLARELYPEFGETRFKLADKLRLDVFEYAAEHGTNLIFTFVYSGDDGDKDFVGRTIATIQAAKSNVLFVELTAPNTTLIERVDNESRLKFHKLKDPRLLAEQLDSNLYNHSVDSPEILKIDTSEQSSTEAAKNIIEHYAL